MGPRFGAHLSVSGGPATAARAAATLGCDTVQIFTKAPGQWRSRPHSDAERTAWREGVAAAGLAGPLVAHAAYLVNLASPDDALWERSVAALADELERAEALGLADLVVHPGAHMGSGEEAGLARAAAGVAEVLRRTAGVSVRLDLESTAGSGSCLGGPLAHLGVILERVGAAPGRLGVCLDTCHLFAAGYPLDEPGGYNTVCEELERAVGAGMVRVWHLNDSQKPRGSRVDRHAGIGRGLIGRGAFAAVVSDPRWDGLPMILETPKGSEDGVDLDAVNLAVLRGLRAAAPAGPVAEGASR